MGPQCMPSRSLCCHICPISPTAGALTRTFLSTHFSRVPSALSRAITIPTGGGEIHHTHCHQGIYVLATRLFIVASLELFGRIVT